MKAKDFNFFDKFRKHLFFVTHSRYKKSIEKITAFRILILLYLKYKLKPKLKKGIAYKIVQYPVYA
jgi:hypothetical protein